MTITTDSTPPPSLPDADIDLDRALADYDAFLAEQPELPARAQELILEALDDAGLAFDQVTVRVKTRPSFVAKLHNLRYPDYVDFASAYDIIGVRVMTYHSSQIEELRHVLADVFDVVRVIDKQAETVNRGTFGYASQHLIVRAPQLNSMLIEIQLRTVLQHAWAEFEHDIRYKNLSDDLDPRVHRAFTLAAGLIELADQQFDLIASLVDTSQSPQPDEDLDAAHLPHLLSHIVGPEYPTSRVDYYAWAVDMLAAHGVTTVAEIRELLSPQHIAALTEAMGYTYHPGQVRLVDDMLLFRYGRDHIRRTVHIGDNATSRPGRLGRRWQALGQRTLADVLDAGTAAPDSSNGG